MGIVTGIFLYLNYPHESLYYWDPFGWSLGEAIHEGADSFFIVDWFLRRPMVYMYSSAIVTYILGMVAYTIVYYRRKIPSPLYWKTLWFTLIGLIIAVVVVCGIAYATATEVSKHGPTQPMITKVWKGYQSPSWPIINSWEVEYLSLSKRHVRIGDTVDVFIGIKNTGRSKGYAQVELEVDSSSEMSKVLLNTYERDDVGFHVIFPKPGTYTLKSGQLSEMIEVVK